MNLSTFYNNFHKKSSVSIDKLNKQNFTYFYILDFLHKHCMEKVRKGEILDVGCGVGKLSIYLNSFAKRTIAIDVSPKAIEIAKEVAKRTDEKRILFKSKELDLEGKFDFIISTEVIEHIEDDVCFLNKLKLNLKQDGLLFITTPSKENLLSKLGFYSRFDKEVGHFRRYTKEELVAKSQKAGFDVVHYRAVEGPLRNILFTSNLGFLIRFIRGPFVIFFHGVDEFFGKILGFSDHQLLLKIKK